MNHIARVVLLLVILTTGSSLALADPAPPAPGPAAPTPTDIQPPLAGTMTTSPAESVHSTFALASGIVRPYDRPVTVAFEYGTTSAYGQTTQPMARPAATEPQMTGLGSPLLGLTPQTTYHYRITVTSDLGSFGGEDQSFTTTPEAPVRANVNALLDVAGGTTSATVQCMGEPDNSCDGVLRVSSVQLVGRRHHRVRRSVRVGAGRFAFSTGPILPTSISSVLVASEATVPISLTRGGRTLMAAHRHLRGTISLTVERGKPVTHRVLLRRG